jgi:hypothetical protein
MQESIGKRLQKLTFSKLTLPGLKNEEVKEVRILQIGGERSKEQEEGKE